MRFTLRLEDKSLARLRNTGIFAKMDFEVKPGTYILRVVSRESEGAEMAAHSGGVVIPD